MNINDDHLEIERMRRAFRPEIIDILLVGESAVGIPSFFYNESADGDFIRCTKEAFRKSELTQKEFLSWLKNNRVFLYDILPFKEQHPNGKKLLENEKIIEISRILSDELKPRKALISVIKRINTSLGKAYRNSGLKVPLFNTLKFPLYQNKIFYKKELRRILDEIDKI